MSWRATRGHSLSDPARLAIVRHLALGEHKVVDLTARLELAQTTVPAHLVCLRDCGLAISRPQGRASMWSLDHSPDLLAAAERALRHWRRGRPLPGLRRAGQVLTAAGSAPQPGGARQDHEPLRRPGRGDVAFDRAPRCRSCTAPCGRARSGEAQALRPAPRPATGRVPSAGTRARRSLRRCLRRAGCCRVRVGSEAHLPHDPLEPAGRGRRLRTAGDQPDRSREAEHDHGPPTWAAGR
ncbi:metalloregulator ArsR/SmtB family transcription factor [Blastococcus sp. HT6-30]|uniref:ArsR/SmtB family transcription factor n=1 Tax=Blastococcus sp. HT6-30 TaxID=3144843 RepID=UPI00321A7E62